VRLTPAKTRSTAPLQEQRYRDMWELSLVKTVIEKPHFIDHILDVLDPSIMAFHGQELTLALQGEFSSPLLTSIRVDDSIKVLEDESALNAELITFLTRYYERELKKINLSQNITFEEKAFYIRKFRGKIAKLKQGELVAYKG
jgi:DNA primase